MSDEPEAPAQLVPVTIHMVLALPADWPKPEEKYDYRGPLARAVYEELIDKLMDFRPSCIRKWIIDGAEWSGRVNGEVESVAVEMGDDCEWGFAAQTIEDELSKPGVWFTLGPDGLGLTASSCGEHEGREPMVPQEAREEWEESRD